MWGAISTDFIFQQNFNFGFSTLKSDNLVHLTQWQYWWWFWFSFIWTLYFLFVNKTVRFRVMKMRPKIVTSFRSHGKWGDFLACIVPAIWCYNILVNSSFIMRLAEWQNEASLFSIRVRGKQWYWIYKFELKAALDLVSVPRNLGWNRWVLNAVGTYEVCDNYFYALKLRSQNLNLKNYWNKYLADLEKLDELSCQNYVDNFSFNKEKVSSDSLLNYFILNKDVSVNLDSSFKNFWVFEIFLKDTEGFFDDVFLSAASWRSFFSISGLKKNKNYYNNFLNFFLKQSNNNNLVHTFYSTNKFTDYVKHNPFTLESSILTDLFKNHSKSKVSANTFLGVNNIYGVKGVIFESFFKKNSALGVNYSTGGRHKFNSFFKKISNSSPVEIYTTSKIKDVLNKIKPAFDIKLDSLEKLGQTRRSALKSVFYNKSFLLEKRQISSYLNLVDFFLNKDFLNEESEFINLKFQKPDSLEFSRFLKTKALEVQPILINKAFTNFLSSNKGAKNSNFIIDISFNKEAVVDKKNINEQYYMIIKQKRYKRKKNIPNRVKNEKNYEGTPIKNDIKLSDKPYLTLNRVLETTQYKPTKLYRALRKNKLRHENISVQFAKRLLRTKKVLVLPVSTNLTIISNSYDVVHSWFIPSMGIKIDCVPGRATHHSFYCDSVGFYYGQCAEICGRYHHHMPIRLCILTFDQFLIWWYHFGLPKFLFTKPKNRYETSYSQKTFCW